VKLLEKIERGNEALEEGKVGVRRTIYAAYFPVSLKRNSHSEAAA